MKLLKDILYKTHLIEVNGSTNLAIAAIVSDSRKVVKDSLFVAVKGLSIDGHQFIDGAIKDGAIAVVCDEFPIQIQENVTYIKVSDSSNCLGVLASNFYDNPSEKLKLVGVTGTNGKTTVATLLFDLFRKLGYSVGLLSTVVNKINSNIIPSTHTTPDALTLNQLLNEMVLMGCSHCFMEVSSHAVVQNRIAGLHFKGAIFTNITRDHLDYHKTFKNYIEAKKGFFDQLPSEAFAIVNKDDANGLYMLQNTKAKKYTYALKNAADFKCKVLESSLSGLLLNIDGFETWVRLIGEFNAYNILAIYATSVLLKENKTNILTTISILSAVEGRFQFYESKSKILGVVDYAHTPDALENVLSTIEKVRTGKESVITVIGCGGDRDAGKRPMMGSLAARLSNKVILTSDNPRTEDPSAIVQQMLDGVNPVDEKKVMINTDRKEAIRMACIIAKPGDIILLAGKGHEKYQEIAGVKYPFDDFQNLKELLTTIES